MKAKIETNVDLGFAKISNMGPWRLDLRLSIFSKKLSPIFSIFFEFWYFWPFRNKKSVCDNLKLRMTLFARRKKRQKIEIPVKKKKTFFLHKQSIIKNASQFVFVSILQDCHAKAIYEEDYCECICQNFDENEKCNNDYEFKEWDESTCSCHCREEQACNPGLSFNLETCRCERKRKI